jgi:hypothetical protein
VGDIGDVHPEALGPARQVLERDRVVKVLGIGRIDGEDLQPPQVRAFRPRQSIPGSLDGLGFPENRSGKFTGEIVGLLYRQEIRIERSLLRETDHNLAAWVFTVGRLIQQPNQHVLPVAGPPELSG